MSTLLLGEWKQWSQLILYVTSSYIHNFVTRKLIGYNQLTKDSIITLYLMSQGRAYFTHELLHSVIIFLGLTHDILAFITTCPSWCAVFTSTKSTLWMLFPLSFSRLMLTKQALLTPTFETHGSSLILLIQVVFSASWRKWHDHKTWDSWIYLTGSTS